MPFAIKPRQTVLFTGDSITDCGRRDTNAPLGNGYVRMVSDLIVAKYPAHGVKVLNTGVGGNSVRDLFDRWTDDVICHQPDWLSVKIGINDVHRWLRQPVESKLDPAAFADVYDQILSRVRKETKAKLVLVEPFYVSRDRATDSFRALILEHLPSYQKAVHALARKYRAPLVRMHTMFQKQLDHHPPDRFGPEPVHPAPSGHLLMAYEWLKVLGW